MSGKLHPVNTILFWRQTRLTVRIQGPFCWGQTIAAALGCRSITETAERADFAGQITLLAHLSQVPDLRRVSNMKRPSYEGV
jgi:hypothetical protein